MDADKKVFVSIYCSIYTDNFSVVMIDKMATGDEIYKLLMKDAGQCFDKSGNLISGDCNLWYLGCDGNAGYMRLDDMNWNWSIGESSFDNVEAFVSALFQKKLISGFQFHSLMDKVNEGRKINNTYRIGKYLLAMRGGNPRIKTPDIGKIRAEAKRLVEQVQRSFQRSGHHVFL